MESRDGIKESPLPPRHDTSARLDWLREFLRQLAHELGSPLTPLAGHLELLTAQTKPQPGTLEARCLTAMRRAVDRFKRLNESVVDVARLERCARPVEAHLTSLGEVLALSVSQVGPSARSRRVTLAIGDIPASVARLKTDQRLLRTALCNVLENAIQHSPLDGVVSITVTPLERTSVRVEIRDVGPGVEARFVNSLTRPFTRLLAQCPDDLGPGLGLTAVALIVQDLEGELCIERAEPGLKVSLTLPLTD